MEIRASNLSINVSDSDVRKLFATFGIINSAAIVRDKLNGRSKGMAIVDMPVAAEARQAIASLNQTMVSGKVISVIEFNTSPQW
jgi:RNA recognition motif-containing protein